VRVRSFILGAAALATGATATAQEINFIACPVYRDTNNGRKSGCWLASDPATGIRYDVTAAPTKADWNKAILVEGFAAPEKGNPCGATVIEPVRVSILEQPCTRHMLPAEGYEGRFFTLPARNVRPLYEDRKRPEKPFLGGRFTIPFDLNKTFITYQISDYYLDATINYALDVQPALIEITGYAQTAPRTISGQTLAEKLEIAQARADVVRRALVMRGVPETNIRIVPPRRGAAVYVEEAFDGLESPTERRVDVLITPR